VRWLVAVVLALALAGAPRVEWLSDDERPAVRALALGETMDPGWAALDDPAVDDPSGDVEKAAISAAAALVLGTSMLGALPTRAARRGRAGWPGSSPTRGPPRPLAVASNSLAIAPSRPTECSIEGRGPPARRRSPRRRPVLCCSTEGSPLQEERS
jgi:hypothetical protein